MNPQRYDFISAPLGLVTALHLLTLTLHLLAMNVLVGGVIAVVWGRFTGRYEHPVVQRFIRLFPSVMAATISLGVAPFLFTQLVYGQVFYSASILSAWYWLAVIPALMIAYTAFYAAAFGNQLGEGRARKISLARTGQLLSLALVAMFFVSVVYSATYALAERPTDQLEVYRNVQSGLVLNPMLGDWILRWLHMMLGAVTVGGYVVALLGRGDEEAFKIGKRFFLVGMIAASLVGLGYLGSLGEELRPFMKSMGIWSLMLSVMLSLGSLHFFFERKLASSGLLLGVSVLGMVVTRHALRLVRLKGSFDPSEIPVQSNWPLVTLFLLSFGMMLAALYWMWRLYRPALQGAEFESESEGSPDGEPTTHA